MSYFSQIAVGLFDASAAPESRATSPESVSFSLSDVNAWRQLLESDGQSSSGVSVTPRSALTVGAVWQAVAAKSHDAAKIPLGIFRKLDGGGSEDAQHPAGKLVNLYGMANDEITGYQLWRRAYCHLSLWQNAFIWIERQNGVPVGLYNLLPDRTNYSRSEKTGRLYVVTEWTLPGGGQDLKAIPVEDVICVEGLAIDDAGGIDLVRTFKDTLGQALAQRNFTSKFFRNNASLGGVLQVPPGTAPEKIAKLEETFSEKYTGSDRAFKVAVLRDGVKFHATMATLQQSAAPELDEQTARQVARFFNMPPSRLGVRESVSYNSLEGDRQNYYDTSLTECLIPAAAQCNVKLLTQQERDAGVYCRHKVASLLWANASTVNSIGVAGIAVGLYTRDEVRGWFEMNPLPDGLGGPQAQQSTNPTNVRAAARAVMDTTLERAAKRLEVHAEKQRRAGKSIDQAFEEQRYAAGEILRPAVEMLSALGSSVTAEQVFESLCRALKEHDLQTATLDRQQLLDNLGL